MMSVIAAVSRAGRVAGRGAAVAGPALLVLRPEAVEGEGISVTVVALVVAARVAFERAPVWRPAERHHVVVEVACCLALGRGGRGGERGKAGQEEEQTAHFLFSPVGKTTI